MRNRNVALAESLDAGLLQFHNSRRRLPGIVNPVARSVLVEQLVESTRRVRYIEVVRGRGTHVCRADPLSDSFDPIRGAMWHQAQGNLEEAAWLTFLSVHFGKNRNGGWRLAADVYGRLRKGGLWDWATASRNVGKFRRWLTKEESTLRGADGVVRGFGNHRKYQSLCAVKPNGTGDAFETYIGWTVASGSHQQKFAAAVKNSGGDPRVAFRQLYKSMGAVASFGRTAKFDYLTMIGKLGLAAIEPDSPYLVGATGPFSGARQLLAEAASRTISRREAEYLLIELGAVLGVGMQVIEDALCNWQKSPHHFIPFRG